VNMHGPAPYKLTVLPGPRIPDTLAAGLNGGDGSGRRASPNSSLNLPITATMQNGEFTVDFLSLRSVVVFTNLRHGNDDDIFHKKTRHHS